MTDRLDLIGQPPTTAPTAGATAVTAGTWHRLKACEAADCHGAYYDRSPAGRGRWCTVQLCGARARMRRYRAKDV